MGDVPEGNPTNGAKIFKQRCAQCHTTESVSPDAHRPIVNFDHFMPSK